MKRFHCDCGSQVFFENDYCLNCQARLGFDPANLDMNSLYVSDSGAYVNAQGKEFRFCDNGQSFGVCNWLQPATATHPLCWGCQFNRTVPNQSLPGNERRWRVLEQGKKRLLFTLIQLGIPPVNGWVDPENGLLLDFIEDSRSRAEFAESFVTTGYLGGVITINTLEADDIARRVAQDLMGENYRTVLGHLRHESGHYFWQRLNPDAGLVADFTSLFGDPDRDYSAALDTYYQNGPAQNWRERYISAYASAHPVEDWAECWGHYLHIYDALETAAAQGIIDVSPAELNIGDRIAAWQGIATALNELNRSIGHRDAYPFTITRQVSDKLAFVDRVIGLLRTLN